MAGGLRRFLLRLYTFLRSARAERELVREVDAHLRVLEEDYARRGMTTDEARQAARRAFGGVDQVMERARDVRSFVWLEDLIRDLRFGIRGLTRNPGFTVTAALAFSIGIGGTAAMFSVTSALLFRPFPAPDPDQLVVVAQRDEHGTNPHFLSYLEYVDYRDQNEVFEGFAAYDNAREMLSVAGGVAGPVWIEYVSRDFFDVLQVDAALGRTFLPHEGHQPGDAAIVVLSYRAWQMRFDADPAVVGRVVQLGATAHTVVGLVKLLVDSLGERTRGAKIRPVAWHDGHAHPATLILGPAHGHQIATTIERTSEAVLQIDHGSLSRAAPLDQTPLDHRRLGHVGPQPASEVLHADTPRPPATPPGDGEVGPAGRRHRAGHDPGGRRGVTA